MNLEGKLSEEHRQLCPHSSVLPPEVLSSTARKAHSAQGQYTIFLSSLLHFAKLASLHGPLVWLLGPMSLSPPLLGLCLMPGCLDACWPVATGDSAVRKGSQHPWAPG